MFLVLISYKKSMAEIDQYRLQHRKFLEMGYKNNYFVVSGPRESKTGGIILSQLTHRKQLENFLKDDPYCIHDVASFEIIEFAPVLYHADFLKFINK